MLTDNESKILLTGGAGFIGSHFAEFLLELGCKVSVLDNLTTGRLENIGHLKGRRGFEFIAGSVMDADLVGDLVRGCDIAIHLAAAVGVRIVVERQIQTIETNVRGTETILRAAAIFQKPIVIASTSEVYGKGNGVPFREDDDLRLGATSHARWAYGCSKAMDEWLALAYWRERSLPVIIVRLFNTVGRRQTGRYGMVLPTFARQAVREEPIVVFGSGLQSRCFAHVADVVKAIFHLMKSPLSVGQIFNVGSNHEISINNLAELVRVAARSKSKIVHISYSEAYGDGFEDLLRRVPDISKLERVAGFKPSTPIEQIISEVVAEQKELIQRESR